MKKTILALVLAVGTSVTWAEWQLLERSENGKSTVYVDPATVRKTGDLVRLWQLVDFKNNPIIYQDKKRANSMKSQHEFNCTEERWRVVYNIPYTGNMAGGSAINASEGEMKWLPVPPGSMSEAVFEFACGKK